MNQPVVVLKGDHSGVSGYSRCTRAYAKALYDAGVNIYFQNHRKDGLEPEKDDFWKNVLSKRTVPQNFKCDIKIWHETPQFYRPDPSCLNVAYTTFETTGIPNTDLRGDPRNNWVAQLNRMNHVVVPCTFNKETFEDYGVTTPITVIPHIVSPPPSTEKVFYEDDPGDWLKFLSIFQWNPRKNPIAMILAYWRANLPKSRLLMKTYYMSFDEKNLAILERLRDLKKSFYTEPAGTINAILERLTDDEIHQLYTSSDIYLTTTRGEGFCLPAVEAMMAGLPVIAPDGTAFKDYMDEEVGYPIEWGWGPVHGMEKLPYGVWYSPETNWMNVNVISATKAIKQAEKDFRTPCSYKGESMTVLKCKGMKAKERAEALSSEKVVSKKYVDLLMSIAPKGVAT